MSGLHGMRACFSLGIMLVWFTCVTGSGSGHANSVYDTSIETMGHKYVNGMISKTIKSNKRGFIDCSTLLKKGKLVSFYGNFRANTEVYLQVWRPTEDGVYKEFRLVAEKRVVSDVISGQQVIKLDEAEMIEVEDGDRLGFWNQDTISAIEAMFTGISHKHTPMFFYKQAKGKGRPYIGDKVTVDGLHYPYHFLIGATYVLADSLVMAKCEIKPDSGQPAEAISGMITLTQKVSGGDTNIEVNLKGFSTRDVNTKHGFHIHQIGQLGDRCRDAGGHFNPYGTTHGAPTDPIYRRHVGDLGNIEEDNNGNVKTAMTDREVSLVGTNTVIGRAIVIHQSEDDLGRVGNTGSLTTGNAGSRLGCCVITEETLLIHATCNIKEDSGEPTEAISGYVTFKQRATGGATQIDVNLRGFNKADGNVKHGIHIHALGKLGNRCKDTGGHYQPNAYTEHGSPKDKDGHAGDLGNIEEDQNGYVTSTILDSHVSLQGDTSVLGRSIVVHQSADDLGKGGFSDSHTTGHAGPRIGCCLITPVIRYIYAQCVVNEDSGEPHERISGMVTFRQNVQGDSTRIDVNLRGFNIQDGNIRHGFHIHKTGYLGNRCKDAGGHYNPFNKVHGSPYDTNRHVGDLGNILETRDGNVVTSIFDHKVSLIGFNSVIGRALVIHQSADDLGRGHEEDSTRTGHAGSRIGCCFIQPVNTYLHAVCDIAPSGDQHENIWGHVRLLQNSTGGATIIYIDLYGFNTRDSYVWHGFHIHKEGRLGNKCKDAGGHYNPHNKLHGAPRDRERHVGDLGNIKEDANGHIVHTITDRQVSLQGSHSVIGRAFVVHQRRDDLGKGTENREESKKTGNAGLRIGCCVIKPAQTQLVAKCDISTESGEPREPVTGTVTFRQSTSGGRTSIDINLTGFKTDDNNVKHGFHVHELGDLGNKCKNAKGHYNPFHKEHGAPSDENRHVGDLGNIVEDANGNCKTTITDAQIQLQGPHTVVGRSIVVHERIDDLGKGGHPDSKITGNAGPRSGCCIIKLV